MNKPIFITGATGYVGKSILKAGIEKGYSFKCLVRNPANEISLWKFPRCEFANGDITNNEELPEKMSDCSAVIHLVGIIAETDTASFEDIHYRGTKNIVDAAKSAGITRFIHMSALGARENGKTAYHISKWKAEEYVRMSGLNYTIFKPSVIFGKEDNFINLFIKIIKLSPVIPAIGSGSLEPIWVEDVAACFISALQNPLTEMKTIELGGGKVYRHPELIKLICKSFNLRRIVFQMPHLLAKLAAIFSEIAITGGLLTRDQLIMLNESNIVRNERPENVFRFSFRSLQDYLEELSHEKTLTK
ncbi:MAG: complex I NDUFA9 subunit family protein [Candidatus Schekmanbacteria bacterium]|nr:complex I NDUFA9 subunit family protein [Candidatus Schekmanbacteria bacterium]